MPFPGARHLTGTDRPAGVVDHRMARHALVAEFRRGRLAQHEVCDAHPELRASLRDVRGAQTAEAPMVFDSLIEPGTGRYLADLDAFARRWRDLGGEVWADPALAPWR